MIKDTYLRRKCHPFGVLKLCFMFGKIISSLRDSLIYQSWKSQYECYHIYHAPKTPKGCHYFIYPNLQCPQNPEGVTLLYIPCLQNPEGVSLFYIPKSTMPPKPRRGVIILYHASKTPKGCHYFIYHVPKTPKGCHYCIYHASKTPKG